MDKKKNQKKKRKKKETRTKYGYLFIIVILLGIFIGGCVGAVSAFIGISKDIPDKEDFITSLSTTIYDIHGKIIAQLWTENREVVPFSKIPKHMVKAVIAIEDSRFYYHHGIDIKSILRSLVQNMINRKIVEGASTITQQLARTSFLTREKTLKRKIKEAILAIQIEKKYSKEEILELYLNEVYFGHGAYGVQSAAHIFFGKDVSELTLAESALLAGLLKGPYYYSPYIYPERAKKRQLTVLKKMLENGFITVNEYRKAIKEEIHLAPLNNKMIKNAPYFVNYVLNILLKDFDKDELYKGGLKIYTTLDLDIQKVAEKTLKDSGYQGAILTINPKNGEIRAMVGGRDFTESQFNRITQAKRQPGSSFKPIYYSAALENGFTAGTIIMDEPMKFDNGWEPKNFDNEYFGPVTLAFGLAYSLNSVGIKIMQKIGTKTAIAYARRFGITTPLVNNLSLALGASEVIPLELISAYTVFPNKGKWIEPHAILMVKDHDGKVLKRYVPKTRQVIKPETAYIMCKLLEGVIRRGTAWRAYIGREMGGKTGSTNDYRDAWFIGFTPDLLTGIYIGNDDNSSLGNRKTGGLVVAPLWKKIMSIALKNVPPSHFEKPKDIVEIPMCFKRGLSGEPDCKDKVKLPFIKGTVPVETPTVNVTPKEEYTPLQENTNNIIITPGNDLLEPTSTLTPEKEETMEELIKKLKEKLKREGKL